MLLEWKMIRNALLVVLLTWHSCGYSSPAENKQVPAKTQEKQSSTAKDGTKDSPALPAINIRNEVSGYRSEQPSAKEQKSPWEEVAWQASAASALIALLAL